MSCNNSKTAIVGDGDVDNKTEQQKLEEAEQRAIEKTINSPKPIRGLKPVEQPVEK